MCTGVLITDFDGTISRYDFYSVIVDQFLQTEDLAPWSDFERGKISHFEALRRIFLRLRNVPEGKIEASLEQMEVEPDLKRCTDELKRAGWEVLVVSNGSNWYIQKIFAARNIDLPVYSNPGKYNPETGLELTLPNDSPFLDPETGIGKGLVVSNFLEQGKAVFFAGDGRPDVAPSLLLPGSNRFARGWLSKKLDKMNEGYIPFSRWADIAENLLSRRSNV